VEGTTPTPTTARPASRIFPLAVSTAASVESPRKPATTTSSDDKDKSLAPGPARAHGGGRAPHRPGCDRALRRPPRPGAQHGGPRGEGDRREGEDHEEGAHASKRDASALGGPRHADSPRDHQPDDEATVARLLANQTDIGNAIKPFYGTAAGNALTDLFRGHILIAADLLLAAKAGDQATLADAQARWEANARDIARFLSSANPRHWKVDALEAMLGEHLRLTTEEAVARLQGDWGADVAAYDRIHHHALRMADTLSQGIVKQFPRRFR
jgi:hypothetical protein